MKTTTKWQQLIWKILFWIVIETMFNLIGIDTLADYSEFLLMPKATTQISHSIVD